MIRLQFSATGDPAAEAIKMFQRGWPSHVDAVMDDGSLLGARLDRIGGVPPGVQIRPAGYEDFTRRLVLNLPATDALVFKFRAFLSHQLGKPYDCTAIAAFPFGRDWHDPNAWFCSELIAAALEDSKWFPQPLAWGANEVTPRDLLLAVSPWVVS